MNFNIGDMVQIRQSTGEWVERPFWVVAIEADGKRLILRDCAHEIPGERSQTHGETADWCRPYENWQ